MSDRWEANTFTDAPLAAGTVLSIMQVEQLVSPTGALLKRRLPPNVELAIIGSGGRATARVESVASGEARP